MKRSFMTTHSIIHDSWWSHRTQVWSLSAKFMTGPGEIQALKLRLSPIISTQNPRILKQKHQSILSVGSVAIDETVQVVRQTGYSNWVQTARALDQTRADRGTRSTSLIGWVWRSCFSKWPGPLAARGIVNERSFDGCHSFLDSEIADQRWVASMGRYRCSWTPRGLLHYSPDLSGHLCMTWSLCLRARARARCMQRSLPAYCKFKFNNNFLNFYGDCHSCTCQYTIELLWVN